MRGYKKRLWNCLRCINGGMVESLCRHTEPWLCRKHWWLWPGVCPQMAEWWWNLWENIWILCTDGMKPSSKRCGQAEWIVPEIWLQQSAKQPTPLKSLSPFLELVRISHYSQIIQNFCTASVCLFKSFDSLLYFCEECLHIFWLWIVQGWR